MAIIDAKYLTKVYKNGGYGLKNCSLTVENGEFLVIVGASGSGKSTLLKVLAGTQELSSGELYLDGILADGIPTSKRDVSMVFQEYVLYPHMTVFDNLATPLKLAGEDEKAIYDRVMETLRLFGLEVAADVKPRNLSGGEQQRVALAKALLKKSRLVLLDEPLSNVDEKARWEYCATLKKMKQLLPESTFIYVTHNTAEAMLLADRIAVMQDGAILQVAQPDFLFKYPESLLSLEIMGKAGNRFDAEFDGESILSRQDLSEFSLPKLDCTRLEKGQRLIAVQSAIGDALCLFDEDGNTVALPTAEITLDGKLNGNVLEFAKQSIELDEEYLNRLLRCPNDVSVGLEINKLSKNLLSNSFSLVTDVVENCGDHAVMRIDGKSFIFNKKTGLKAGEKIRLYYKIEDLIIYECCERLTCHYPLNRKVNIKVIDRGQGKIEILGKRIKLNSPISGSLSCARITASGFELSYTKGRHAVALCGCLDEEFINGEKLSHIAVKNVDGYLSLMSNEDICCFGKNKVWLNIIPDGLEFEEAR